MPHIHTEFQHTKIKCGRAKEPTINKFLKIKTFIMPGKQDICNGDGAPPYLFTYVKLPYRIQIFSGLFL